jgi:hypothetical protein
MEIDADQAVYRRDTGDYHAACFDGLKTSGVAVKRFSGERFLLLRDPEWPFAILRGLRGDPLGGERGQVAARAVGGPSSTVALSLSRLSPRLGTF